MKKLIELTVDCSNCGYMIEIQINSLAQVKDYDLCPACKVLAKVA